MIEKHMGLVVAIAKKYRECNHKLEIEDLVAEGTLGLWRACKTHDESKGKFSTHAYWWIRKYIQEAIEKNGNTVYLPRYMRAYVATYYAKKNELINTIYRIPTTDEVLDTMEVSNHERECIRKALRVTVVEAIEEMEG